MSVRMLTVRGRPPALGGGIKGLRYSIVHQLSGLDMLCYS